MTLFTVEISESGIDLLVHKPRDRAQAVKAGEVFGRILPGVIKIRDSFPKDTPASKSQNEVND